MQTSSSTVPHLNILVVEDHDALREVTLEALSQAGHYAHGVDSAEAVPDEAGLLHIDLCVVDLNLPGEDGISLATRLRATQPHIGIIMVTARNRSCDRQAGYESGADIYLAKPTSPTELCAAVQALARRLKPAAGPASGFHLNLHRLELTGPGGHILLSTLEAAQLAAFVRAKDQQLDSWQLMQLNEKEVTESSKKTLEVQVVRLRKKLLQAGAVDPVIRVIRGQGYRLCVALSLPGG
jgi:DNA-binding response OmpR family regulator